MLALTWLTGTIRRRGGRFALTIAGVAVAVALLGSLGAFLAGSKATMTTRAIARVAVDWQVQAAAGADLAKVAEQVASFPGVTATELVSFGATPSLSSTVGGSTQTTGAGVVLGLPDSYRSTFGAEIRQLTGARTGVLLAQQTAANLHAAVGDTVTIDRPGVGPVDVRVDGVVELPQADSLFQAVGAPVGAQPQAPPDNVILLPAPRWHELFDPVVAARPESVHTQVHTRLAHDLPTDPAAAFDKVSGSARNLEVRLAGTGLVGNNLGATLDAARNDALYSQVLFLFLGLPGVVLAALLTATVADSSATRRRADQALLRSRGATTSDLVRLGLVEAAAVGVAGAVVGLGVAAAIGTVAFGSAGFGAGTAATAWMVGAALCGLLIAAATIGLRSARDARSQSVAASRLVVGQIRPPWWYRAKVDGILLALGGIVFWLTSRAGYKLVLAVEGLPQLSVSYWAFAGPALIWIGASLLTWR